MKPGADRDLIQHLSGAVADGEEIDWEAAERRLGQGSHGSTLAALRLVSGLARVPPGTRDLVGRVPSWMWGLAALVVAQLVLGATALALPTALPVGGVLQVAAAWTFGLAALLLVQRPPLDRRCLALAGAFLSIASASTFSLARQAALASGSPLLAPLEVPLAECLLPLFLWRFARLFPSTRVGSSLDRRAEQGARLAGVAGALLGLASLLGFLARQGWVYWPVLLGMCIPALHVMWLRRRDAEAEERRRVVVFVGAIAAGLAPLISLVLADATLPAVSRLLDRSGVTPFAAAIVYGCLLTIPLTTAHAAGSARLVSVPALVRTAARRALGRAALGSVLALSGALLAFRLWQSRHDSLADLVGDRVACLLAAAALGAALLLRWRRPLASLLGLRPRETWNDRIASIGGQIHGARPDLLAGVVEKVLGGFLDAPVSLLVRGPDAVLAARSGLVPPLPPDHALAVLAFQGRSPLAVGPDTALFACLPGPDRDWVLQGRVDRLVPIQGIGGALGLLALGAAKNADLDREDLQGLEALGATLALALESGPAESVTVARECGGCGVLFETEPPCGCGASIGAAVIPRLLNGKFQVERRLGRGGMGVVYLARDLELERAVALKTLPRLSGEAARRLRTEARAMASVRHPNVAQVYGLESWGGAPVVVLEYLPGGTLAARLPGPLGVGPALDLAISLADGLAAVHAAGLLHRDVKPSNVGFDADGTPRLLDFGLSRVSPEASSAPAAPDLLLGWAGTPLYMAPTVLSGGEPGPADDVWSLLVLLHECLAGVHPLRGVPRDDLLSVLRRGGFPDLRSSLPGPAAPLAEKMRSWLEAGGSRPGTALELRAALVALRFA